MERLITKKYKMFYPSEEKLIKLGFKKMRGEDHDVWRYSFPVYKYNNKISLIDCVINVTLPGGKVALNVFSNGNIYPPFYDNEYGNHEPIMNIINSNIIRKLNELKIKEKKRKV